MVVLWKWTLIFGVFVLSLNAGHAYAGISHQDHGVILAVSKVLLGGNQ